MRRKKIKPAERPLRKWVVSTRLDENELEIAKAKCKASGRKMADYCRMAITGAKINELMKAEDMKLLRQIGGMSTLLNQMATRLNSKGHRVEMWQVLNTTKQISDLYNQLSDDWKHH